MSSTERPLKVLYIIGWGRSGSTILANLLGEIDGFFHSGELSYLWERGLLEGRRCGCGRSLRDCDVWSSVLATSFGPGGVAPDAHEMVSAQREQVRVRHTWRLLKQPLDRLPENPALRSYCEAMLAVYQGIEDATGARVLVDSSKRPSDGALLRLLPGIAPYFVHLVRDPRAVAYSWGRMKAQLDRSRPGVMSPHSVVDSTSSWLSWNLAAEALRKRTPRERWTLVRYEDFVAEPRAALERITSSLGEAGVALPISAEGTARLSTNHTVSGNPDRFSTGEVKLREDREWRSRQARSDRLLSTLMALPLLNRYDYGWRGVFTQGPGS